MNTTATVTQDAEIVRAVTVLSETPDAVIAWIETVKKRPEPLAMSSRTVTIGEWMVEGKTPHPNKFCRVTFDNLPFNDKETSNVVVTTTDRHGIYVVIFRHNLLEGGKTVFGG